MLIMKSILITFLTVLICTVSFGQTSNTTRLNRFVDVAGTVGQSQGTTAASYVHNWKIGKKRKLEAGLGLRWTSYVGTKTNFTTAPARLARSNTTPFLIVFAGQETQNWDTLTVQRPFINSLNLSANFGYNFNKRWSLGFNIDLIGFSFGRKGSGILTSDGKTRNEPAARPVPFNVLLTGDLDRGSLNSEYFVKYRINEKWGVKAVYEFYFGEYETSTVKQIAPDGTEVSRFRNKANTLGLGISYHFIKK
jgi:hypothetical protein